MSDNIQVHRLPITKAMLSRLPADRLRLFVLCGHASNELLTLRRLISFHLNATVGAETLMYNVASGRSFIMFRLLAGKVWECHELIRRRLLSNPAHRKLIEGLPPAGAEALKRCKERLGKDSPLARLRNNHGFHFPDDDLIDHAMAHFPEEEETELVLSDDPEATFYHAAELCFEIALVQIAGSDPVREGGKRMAELTDQVFNASNDAFEVFNNVMGEIAREHFSDPTIQTVEHTVSVPQISAIVIPPLGRSS